MRLEPERPSGSKKRSAIPPGALSFAFIGTEFALGVLACTLMGWLVDRGLGSGRTATLIGALLGLIGGFYNFVKQAMALQKRIQDESSRPPATPPEDEDRNAS